MISTPSRYTTSSGLINVKNASQLKQEDDTKAKAAADAEQEMFKKKDTDGIEATLTSHIRKAWFRNRRHKTKIEKRLLDCLRARLGKYSDNQINSLTQHGGADPVYLKITGTKCRAASAWIRDIMLPANRERPWMLDTTTIPDLNPELEAAIRSESIQHASELIQGGAMPSDPVSVLDFIQKVRDEAYSKIKEEAEKAAEGMEDKIQDLMDEGDWRIALEELIEDFVTYPTSFLKGPFLRNHQDLSWEKGSFKPVVKDQISLAWQRVSPFDIYPGAYVKTVQKGDLIERLRLDLETLYNMKELPGYKSEAITACIEEYEQNQLKDWLWEDFERFQLESDTGYLESDPDTIDGLQYWGVVKGKLLIDWGITKDIEPDKPYHVEAILIGTHVIRAVINTNPLGMRPYHSACWDAVPGSIWGIALPEQMDDHQKIINASARALCDNMSLSSGPQVVVLTDMLASGEDLQGMYPRKIWQAKSSITGNSGKPIDFFQPDSNAEELIKIINQFTVSADDVTNVPRYSYGNESVGGAGNTASGLSMLMNSASKGIRRAISNIDSGIIQPSVYQAFIHIMLHDDDVTIKGDCKVVPQGAAALLIREQLQNQHQAFLANTANPIDMQIIGLKGRAKILKQVAKELEIPDGVVPDDDELDAREKQQQAMAQQQAQVEAAKKGPVLTPDQQAMGQGNQDQIIQNKVMG